MELVNYPLYVTMTTCLYLTRRSNHIAFDTFQYTVDLEDPWKFPSMKYGHKTCEWAGKNSKLVASLIRCARRTEQPPVPHDVIRNSRVARKTNAFFVRIVY